MSEFFQTPMGRQFYDRTLPALVQAVQQLTAEMARLRALLEAQKGGERGSQEDKQGA